MVHRHCADRTHTTSSSSGGSGGFSTISPEQAWAILKRHARDEIAPLRLRELCTDEDRVAALVAVHNTSSQTEDNHDDESDSNYQRYRNKTLIVDISRQLLTDVTMNHLFTLSTAMGLHRFIRQVAWGSNNPDRPARPIRPESQNNNGGSTNTDPHNHHHASTSAQHHMQDKAFRLHQHLHHHHGPNHNINTTFSQDTFDSVHTPSAGGNIYSGSALGTTTSLSSHLALRVPANQGHAMYNATGGTNLLTDIHETWQRLQRFSHAIRSGKLKGANGHWLRDVVVVGQGVAVAALQFAFTALVRDERANAATRSGLPNQATSLDGHAKDNSTSSRLRLVGNIAGALQQHAAGHLSSSSSTSSHKVGRRLEIVSSVDPNVVASAVSSFDPASTLVISVALTGNEETSLATSILKQWLIQGLSNKSSATKTVDAVLTKHMILVTGNDRIAASIHKPESVYVIPDYARCEPYTSFTVATLLPLSIVFGWSIVQELLAGAHDLDVHFVESNPRHNLPVLLALTDLWNSTVLHPSSVRAVIPFTEAFDAFPKFVAALESQACHGSAALSAFSAHSSSSSSMIVDGSLFGALDRALFETNGATNTELVMAMDTQSEFNTSKTLPSNKSAIHSAQDALMCSFLAQADELAFGKGVAAAEEGHFVSSPMSQSSPHAMSPRDADMSAAHSTSGNRPSVLLMCGKLDAFACGQLIALSEHRAIVKAHLLGLDPFATRDVGPSFRRDRTDSLGMALAKLYITPSHAEDETEDGDKDEGMTLSTKTLLSHYASLAGGTRV